MLVIRKSRVGTGRPNSIIRRIAELVTFVGIGALAACGSDTSNTREVVDPVYPVASSVDPQALKDVISATFMVPGDEVTRAMRVDQYARQLGIEECGGQGGPIDDTSSRFDQSNFADPDLIRRKGLTEDDAIARDDRRLDELPGECEELAPDVPAFKEWSTLRATWMDVVESAKQDPRLVSLKAPMAKCLTDKTGLHSDPENPTAFLAAVNLANSKGAPPEELKNYSVAYADCGGPYFDELKALLVEKRPAMVERHRELIDQYASELVGAGYTP